MTEVAAEQERTAQIEAQAEALSTSLSILDPIPILLDLKEEGDELIAGVGFGFQGYPQSFNSAAIIENPGIQEVENALSPELIKDNIVSGKRVKDASFVVGLNISPETGKMRGRLICISSTNQSRIGISLIRNPHDETHISLTEESIIDIPNILLTEPGQNKKKKRINKEDDPLIRARTEVRTALQKYYTMLKGPYLIILY